MKAYEQTDSSQQNSEQIMHQLWDTQTHAWLWFRGRGKHE